MTAIELLEVELKKKHREQRDWINAYEADKTQEKQKIVLELGIEICSLIEAINTLKVTDGYPSELIYCMIERMSERG